MLSFVGWIDDIFYLTVHGMYVAAFRKFGQGRGVQGPLHEVCGARELVSDLLDDSEVR